MNSILLNLLFSGLGAFAPQILPLLQKIGVDTKNPEFAEIEKLLNSASSLSLFGNAISQYGNYARQQEQQQYERNFALNQYQYNQQQNQINRELSSPIGQITAYKRAGLSPDLLFGQLSQPFMSSGVSQAIPTSIPQTNSMESLQASNLLEGTEKIKNENKQLNEITKGTQFDNEVKKFNATLHKIYNEVTNYGKDVLSYGLKRKLISKSEEILANSYVTDITNQMLNVFTDKLMSVEDLGNGVQGVTFTETFYTLCEQILDKKLADVETSNIKSNLERYLAGRESEDKEFWYNSKYLGQEVANTLGELSKTNAEIERQFLNGKLTKESFFKALLIVLSKAIGK